MRIPFVAALGLSLGMPMAGVPALAWDSAHPLNRTHPTHTYLTECALQRVGSPELAKYRTALIDGANSELHELPVKGSKYGVDLDAKRQQHKGTNEGTADIAGWWQESVAAHRAGRMEQAYFYLGVMLHMIQDMGVPAHANRVYHQGTLKEFDNFEFMATWNWKPSFAEIYRTDPGHAEPWRYYAFSEAWTKADAPDYRDRSKFSKTWASASEAERRLLSNRQGRTCVVVAWALQSALKAFKAP